MGNPQMAEMGADGKQAKGLCPCSRDFTAEDAEDRGGRGRSHLPPSALIGDICGSSPDLHRRRIPWLMGIRRWRRWAQMGCREKGCAPVPVISPRRTPRIAEDGADPASLHLRWRYLRMITRPSSGRLPWLMGNPQMPQMGAD